MMKKLFIIPLFLGLAFGCKKQTTKPVSLIGSWELRLNVGGIAGIRQAYAPGNGSTLQFNADSSFTAYSQFQLVNRGKFHVVKNAFVSGNLKADGLYFNDSGYVAMLGLSADTLRLSYNYPDAVNSTYVRQ